MKNKNGISLITLVITIIVMIILATIVVLTFKNTNIIGDSNETKYKNELKKFDQEVRSNIASAYLKDDTIIYRVITDPEEIKKYSQDLVNSEYINYAYISGGELTLRGNLLTEEQKKWAQEANIKVDNQSISFTDEKVAITINSDDNWTQGPISATLTFSNIPEGYELQYKVGNEKWKTGNFIGEITNNCTLYARLYNKNNFEIIGENTKDVTKIDRKAPSIIEVKEPEGWSSEGLVVTVVGAKDSESGLAETAYSFDDGATWQKENSKNFTANQNNVIIKVRDSVGNIYTHSPINIDTIDDILPIIAEVTGNPTDWIKGSVTLTVNGAKDNESGLAETAYSFDNGASWQASNSKTFMENTSNIVIKVRDMSGNTYTHDVINIQYIDITTPKITNVAGDLTGWVNDKVTLVVEGAIDDESGLAEEPYSFDNGMTWQSNNTKIYTEKTSNIIIKVKDKVGNIYTHEVINIDKIDNVAPTITSVSGNPMTWTKDDVILAINGASDNESGLAEEPYSFDNGVTWQSENTNTFTENMLGIVIKVKDKAGNIYTHEAIDIIYIDKNAPTITSVTGNATSWKSDDVTLTVNGAGDDASGLNETDTYSFDGGITWQTSNTKSYTSNESDIIIKVKDIVGNVYTHEAIDITYIDKNAPTITSVIGNATTWTNNDVTLTIKGASDNESGLHASETYSFDNGVSWQTKNEKTYIENESGIIVKVKDAAGNIYTHDTIDIVYIDKEAPSKPTGVDITSDLNTITVKASGSIDSGSGIAGYKYKLGENGSWSNTIDVDTTYTFDDQIKSNTTVEIYAKAIDKLGYESTEYGPVDGTTSTVTNKVAITLSTEEWTKGPVTANLSYDNVPSGYVIQYKIGTGEWTLGAQTVDISSNTTVYGRLYNESLDDEIATNSKNVSRIDNESPTDPTGLEIVTRNQTSLVVQASGSTDSGSGLAGYQYSVNGTSWSETVASGTNHTISSLLDNSEYTVYVRAIDALGNISENNYTKEATTLSTYSVTYNSNTAETVGNIPTTQTKVEGITLTLSTSIPTRTGYRFNGWSTTTTGSVEYAAGADYTVDSELVLYAVWEMAYYQNTTTSKLYVTLNEAITDSATGTQINVIRNATESVVATNTSGKTLTLNLNNKTISFNDGYNLVNAGTLTLIGSGKITANTGYTINNSGTLNVNLDNETSYNDGTGGIIEMTSSLNVNRAINSSGNLIINSGVVSNSAAASAMIDTEYPYVIVTNGTTTINGGIIRSISSDFSTQYGLYTTGPFSMNGGTIEAVGTALYTGGSANTTITGGKIITGGVNNTTQRVAINHKSTGTLQFSGTNSIEVYSKLYIGIYNQSTGNIIIGNSNCTITALIRAIDNRSTGQVTINNGTLKITSTTSTGNCIHNSVGGKIIINGGTVQASTNSTIYNAAAGTIEINGGTISSLSGMTNNAGGTVKITGGTITGTNSQGILNNGAGTINITGGSVIGYNNGIYGSTNSTGTVTVTGGSITGQNSTGIIGKWGTVTLGTNDSTISTTSPAITGKTYGINMTAGTLNFYDGVVKGATAINNTVTGLPTNYGVVTTTANSVQTATLAKKYYVKYNANGGSGTMANSTHLYGVSKALTANAFTRTGYTFAGWATSSTGSVAYANSASVSNLTTTAGGTVNLYAKWTPITYTVAYNANGGSGTMANTSHTYDVAANLRANTFTRTGYSFAGWATSASGAVVYANSASVKNLRTTSGTITLYAVWKENIVITFSGSQGSVNNNQVVCGSGGSVSAGLNATVPANCTVYYKFNISTNTQTTSNPNCSSIGEDTSTAYLYIKLDGTIVAGRTKSGTTYTGDESGSFTTTKESEIALSLSPSVGSNGCGVFIPSVSITIEKIVLNSTGETLTLAVQ